MHRTGYSEMPLDSRLVPRLPMLNHLSVELEQATTAFQALGL